MVTGPIEPARESGRGARRSYIGGEVGSWTDPMKTKEDDDGHGAERMNNVVEQFTKHVAKDGGRTQTASNGHKRTAQTKAEERQAKRTRRARANLQKKP